MSFKSLIFICSSCNPIRFFFVIQIAGLLRKWAMISHLRKHLLLSIHPVIVHIACTFYNSLYLDPLAWDALHPRHFYSFWSF
ncbi:hypothetical protein BCR41DRAFT_225883 [Lobosporangium transversale]|uniref:Uncharacterized protein n=1 Tax=Lobosporangium transversale TaxID=64571 RepID=A0A1Y2G6L6_9FUNG|nr:hypothetical protein BCR41DRAFT_225883 [Lobosporangium transversale]ORY98381.1 hypothetical protein BCR41DRAFT_225883 [Lobosporangium transversale]|eukprot:XP_021875773.1 hypothetical protein BCR41DRAFT_225883 [Lobosporangium transversale]